MTHEELKKQYQEDVKKYGKDAYTLWEYKSAVDGSWCDCSPKGPEWRIGVGYRRKEQPFEPEYFSGLNWRDAEKLIGKVVEFSDDTNHWTPGTFSAYSGVMTPVHKFLDERLDAWIYIRTTPETYTHPTITITVNNRLCRLPKPETEAPRNGATAWIISPFHPDGYVESVWQGFGGEQIALEKGYVHLTENRAQAWADWWNNVVMAAVRGGE